MLSFGMASGSGNWWFLSPLQVSEADSDLNHISDTISLGSDVVESCDSDFFVDTERRRKCPKAFRIDRKSVQSIFAIIKLWSGVYISLSRKCNDFEIIGSVIPIQSSSRKS